MIRKTWYDLGKYLVSVFARAGFDLNIQWKAPVRKARLSWLPTIPAHSTRLC